MVTKPGNQIPLIVQSTNTGSQMIQKRNMLGTAASVVDPADMTLSALTLKLITWAAQQNHLGTNTPSELIIGIDDLNRFLYMVPVVPNTMGATPLTRKRDQGLIKLYEAFRKLDRLVQPGIREYYKVHPTPGQVTIRHTTTDALGQVTVQEVVKGWGIYIDLHDVTKEPIRTLSAEEKAARKAKLTQTLAAKKQHT